MEVEWDWRAGLGRRSVGRARVGVGRAGGVRKREGRIWIEVRGQAWRSLEEEGVLGLGVEMGRDKGVQAKFDAVRRTRRDRCRPRLAHD